MTDKGEIPQELLEIGNFIVTDTRGLGEYLKCAHISLDKIPLQARVLEIGSSFSQRFARELRSFRPDVFTISLDPSLALPVAPGSYTNNRIKHPEKVIFTYNSSRTRGEFKQPYSKTRLKRMQEAEPGTIAATINLPIASSSQDLVVDMYAAAMYLNNGSLGRYYREIVRVLKPGGEAHIYPVSTRYEYLNRTPLRTSRQRVENEFSTMPDNQQLQFYKEKDYYGETRLGLIIVKENVI